MILSMLINSVLLQPHQEFTPSPSILDGVEFYFQQSFCVSYLNVVFPKELDVKAIYFLYDATYLKEGKTSDDCPSKFWFVLGEARNSRHKSLTSGGGYMEINHKNYPLEFFEWTGNKVQMGITNLFPPMPESVYIEVKAPNSNSCSKTFKFESMSETETELLGRKLIPVKDESLSSKSGSTVFAPMGR